MAGFVQVIEFDTSHIDEVRMLGEKFVAERQASGESPGVKGMLTVDRERPNHYLNIVEFPSYEEAMQNSNRPETTEFAARLAELCESPPVFHNLDIVQRIEA
jgi:quinol monooxygenase YgiN